MAFSAGRSGPIAGMRVQKAFGGSVNPPKGFAPGKEGAPMASAPEAPKPIPAVNPELARKAQLNQEHAAKLETTRTEAAVAGGDGSQAVLEKLAMGNLTPADTEMGYTPGGAEAIGNMVAQGAPPKETPVLQGIKPMGEQPADIDPLMQRREAIMAQQAAAPAVENSQQQQQSSQIDRSSAQTEAGAQDPNFVQRVAEVKAQMQETGSGASASQSEVHVSSGAVGQTDADSEAAMQAIMGGGGHGEPVAPIPTVSPEQTATTSGTTTTPEATQTGTTQPAGAEAVQAAASTSTTEQQTPQQKNAEQARAQVTLLEVFGIPAEKANDPEFRDIFDKTRQAAELSAKDGKLDMRKVMQQAEKNYDGYKLMYKDKVQLTPEQQALYDRLKAEQQVVQNAALTEQLQGFGIDASMAQDPSFQTLYRDRLTRAEGWVKNKKNIMWGTDDAVVNMANVAKEARLTYTYQKEKGKTQAEQSPPPVETSAQAATQQPVTESAPVSADAAQEQAAAQAKAAEQQRAFDEINGLGYQITADTDPAILFATLAQEKGWQIDPQTKQYVEGAIGHVKAQQQTEAASAAGPEQPGEQGSPDAQQEQSSNEPVSLEAKRQEKQAQQIQELQKQVTALQGQLKELAPGLKALVEKNIAEEKDPEKKTALQKLLTLLSTLALGTIIATEGVSETVGSAQAA